jgi:hypothetical protein
MGKGKKVGCLCYIEGGYFGNRQQIAIRVPLAVWWSPPSCPHAIRPAVDYLQAADTMAIEENQLKGS